MTRTPLLAAVSALSLFAAAAPAPARLPATQPATAPATRPSRDDRAMTISPAAADDAADLFVYSQQALDLRDENAATLYLQALIVGPHWTTESSDEWNRVYDLPPEQRDPAAVEKLLQRYRLDSDILEPAVRREWADFGAPARELGIAALLPYLNEMRQLANAMDLYVDYHRLRGERAEAEAMTRRLFVLGLHVGNSRSGVLVDGLVGVGISTMAVNQAVHLAEMPDAPNRYWALTDLPRPAFDVMRWMRAERAFLDWTFPAIRTPALMDAARWRNMQDVVMNGVVGSDQDRPEDVAFRRQIADPSPDGPLATAARRFLKGRGATDAGLDAMGLYPMLAAYLGEDYKLQVDRLTAALGLPYPQANGRLRKVEEGQAEMSPLTRVMLSTSFRFAPRRYLVRLDRLIDAARTVEAIRDYAASHDGLPPAELADCRLPVPDDVATGRPFGYAADGRTFVLTAAPPEGADRLNGFVWSVTLRE